MKPSLRKFVALSLTLCALFGGAVQGHSQITVKVDSTQQWLGFINYFQTNGTSYIGGFANPGANVRGIFIPTNSPSGWPLNSHLILSPNTSTYDTNGAYNYPDGSPERILEANFYRDVFTAFNGQTVTFEGTVTTNSIPAPSGAPATGWILTAVIKEFTAPNYGYLGATAVPLVAGSPFTVSRSIGAGNICQYGFILFGPNTATNSANAGTGVGILVEDGDPAITTQPVARTVTTGTTTNLSVVAVGSTTLGYQWQRNSTNLLNGGNISGANSATLGIANAQLADTGPYQVIVTNTIGGSVTSAVVQVTVLDILINTPPVSRRVEQGSTVVFSVGASSSSALSYQWKSVIGGVTNNLSNGPNVSGSTSNVLTLSDVQPAQSGTYVVRITAGSESADTSATLLVRTYAQYANFLENPGFENDPTGVNESPWIRFESTEPSFGSFQDATDTYFGGGNVNVYQGTYVSYTTFNAVYSGIYQDVVAEPGQIFAADMWFYNASGDPIPGPLPAATNESFIEIQFRNSPNGTPLQQYISSFMHYDTPQNVWTNLQATTAGGYGTIPPAPGVYPYLVAPPGTTLVRFQFTLHDISGSVGLGSIYYDSAQLMLKVPAAIGATQTGNNIVLTWKSQGATSYQVQYRDGLADVWHNLEVVAGTGLVISRSYPASGTQRFYQVLTL